MSQFFEGWYCKHQNQRETLAFIPGFADGKAFIQAITDEKSYYFEYALSTCHKGRVIKIGDSVFSSRGLSLDIHQGGHHLIGKIAYTDLTPLESDIMGFFRFFPMQCRHGVMSLHHSLRGTIWLDGKAIELNNGIGYLEKDSGWSFPKSYTWVQANDFPEKCSVMAAVADIPFMGVHFRGVICAIWHKGREYRLATYNGAKAVHCTKNSMVIAQGPYRLAVEVIGAQGHSLAAPRRGKMSRMIKENPSCRARFRFRCGGDIIFDMESDKTSFEFDE